MHFAHFVVYLRENANIHCTRCKILKQVSYISLVLSYICVNIKLHYDPEHYHTRI